MDAGHLTIKAKQFLEETGLFFEHQGLPRMLGRVLGWLLICDPPYQSPAQLGEATSASKGAISTSLKLLTSYGLIEKLGLPGERRGYYRLKENAWEEMLKRGIESLTALRHVGQLGKEILAGQPAEQQKRLNRMVTFYDFFTREYPAMLEQWKEIREKVN